MSSDNLQLQDPRSTAASGKDEKQGSSLAPFSP